MRSVFEEQARAKGIELEVDECEDVVRTDRGLLERIVENLVSNAIRYTQQGAVSLRCLHESSLLRIEVADTGIGIPTEEIDLVFEEFYQSTQKGGAKKEGLGLGLAIVQRLAGLLQHEIRIDSTPGVGTRFAVEVPRAETAESAMPSEFVDTESTARAFAIRDPAR
jgi:signal transduction histidine kinase